MHYTSHLMVHILNKYVVFSVHLCWKIFCHLRTYDERWLLHELNFGLNLTIVSLLCLPVGLWNCSDSAVFFIVAFFHILLCLLKNDISLSKYKFTHTHIHTLSHTVLLEHVVDVNYTANKHFNWVCCLLGWQDFRQDGSQCIY